MRTALLLALLSLGCARSEIDVTARFDSSVDDAALARIVELLVTASGVEPSTDHLRITPEVRQTREARFVYRTLSADGVVDLDLAARDAGGDCIAHGTAAGIVLRAHAAVPATVTLSAGDCPAQGDLGAPGDLGVDAAADLGVDAGADLATSADGGCGNAGVLVCEDFESGDFDHAVWSPLNAGAASASVDETRAYRGSHALHVHVTPPADGGAPFSEGLILETAAMPDPLYVRAFVYLPPTSLTDGPVLLDARQVGSPYGNIQLGADTAGLLVGDTLSPPFTAHSSASIATNRWLCIEWRVAGAGGLDTRTWLDGTELSELHRTGAAISPSFGLLRVGVALVASVGRPPYDIWFDEIEIDSKPIGCLK